MPFHHRAGKLFTLIASVALISACITSRPQPEITAGVDADLGTLVSTEWLSQHLDDPDLVVLDCTVLVEMDGTGSFRALSGRSGYEAGHIPSAGFADLMSDLSDNDSPFEFAMPTPEKFSAAMARAGCR